MLGSRNHHDLHENGLEALDHLGTLMLVKSVEIGGVSLPIASDDDLLEDVVELATSL